jgi:hypothetical protein
VSLVFFVIRVGLGEDQSIVEGGFAIRASEVSIGFFGLSL